MGSQISILVLWKLCSESLRAWNFEILVEDSDTGGLSSTPVRIEWLFAFQFWNVNFVWKTAEREVLLVLLGVDVAL